MRPQHNARQPVDLSSRLSIRLTPSVFHGRGAQFRRTRMFSACHQREHAQYRSHNFDAVRIYTDANYGLFGMDTSREPMKTPSPVLRPPTPVRIQKPVTPLRGCEGIRTYFGPTVEVRRRAIKFRQSAGCTRRRCPNEKAFLNPRADS
jgi:hypothetical protein